VTPAFVGCVGLSMILLVVVANAYVVHYARGVMQAAVEEGGRQGVALGDVGACLDRVVAVVRSGLGTMADEVGDPGCTLGPDGAVVSLHASFDQWLPGLPPRVTEVRAQVGTGR
jgi:hypothetical protein